MTSPTPPEKNENIAPLDGQIKGQQNTWEYTFKFPVPLELQDEYDRLKKIRADLEKSEQDLRNDCSAIGRKLIPVGWKIKSIAYPYSREVTAHAHCYGLNYTAPEPKKTPPEAKLDPYQTIAQRHDLKQILNSGVLTKEERRKVLGLPPLNQQEEKP